MAVLLAATWIYDYIRMRDVRGSIYAAALDVALLALLGLCCLFIFAQFVLPTKTLSNRLRVAGRLWLHAWGAHGPAVFVQNGRKVERRDEARKSGPGVIWIDTASAALLRMEVGPTRVLGPGIHFTNRRERIEKSFSLHTQACTIGPGLDEPIFERLAEDADEDERAQHVAMQARRRETSGLTRDGNEVVPQIRVTFKLDGKPAAAGQPGSRFGFSGEAVERAARGEGLNVDPVTARRTEVAWNQLPGLIAVDLWREYLARFTLDDLFTARFGPVPEVLQPEEPAPTSEPKAGIPGMPGGRAARLLWRMNNRLESNLRVSANSYERTLENAPSPGPPQQIPRMLPGREYTALQVIARLVAARMSQATVTVLDDSGRYGRGHVLSEESKRLRERGISILEVSLSGFRFSPAVEAQIVEQWRTTWLESAGADRVQVEQLEVLAAEAGRQKALLEHAAALGRALRAEPETSVPAALKALLVASHGELLTDERLRGRGSEDLAAILELAKWVDSGSND